MLMLLLSLVTFAGPTLDSQVHASVAQRHDAGCDAVFALGEQAAVRDALIASAATQSPPWAPLRAASCVATLAGSDAVALEASRAWVRDAQAPGLALAVVERIDAMPEPVAVELAGHALTTAKVDRRLGLLVTPRLTRSTYASVRALTPSVD